MILEKGQKKLKLNELKLDFIELILEESKKELELNQSKLDFIRMVLDFIKLTQSWTSLQ
jgi:hypothetical protein